MNKEKEILSRKEEIKDLKEYRKALYSIDMVQGFVNFGSMANPNYNNLVPQQLKVIDDFVRTYARYLDEINKKVNLFVVESTVDTFDKEKHNREEWKRIARMVMEQAGVIYVENYEELKEKEKTLGLR